MNPYGIYLRVLIGTVFLLGARYFGVGSIASFTNFQLFVTIVLFFIALMLAGIFEGVAELTEE